MICRACLSITISGLLAGCAPVSLSSERAPSSLPSAPHVSAPFIGADQAATNVVDQPVPGQYWRFYADPRLDLLVNQALAANTDLRVALANITRAEARVSAAQVARTVQTGLGGGLGVSGRGDSDPVIGTNAAVQIGYEIDVTGRLKRQIEAAKADVGAAEAAHDLARTTIVAGVVRAFVDVCGAGYRRRVAERQLDLQQQSLAITNRLIAAGRGTVLDRERSSVLVEQIRASLPQFDAAADNGLFRLAVLTGKPPADLPQDMKGCADLPRLTRPLPVGDGAALIRRRPDIRMAERELTAASTRIDIAEAELYPQVHLGGSLGMAGPVASFGSTGSVSFGLGPLISWTFPNRRLARAHIAENEAIADAALARFDGQVLGALREVETALANYARDLDRHTALQMASDQAQSALGHARQLFRHGRTDALNLLDAERQYADRTAALAESDLQLADDQVALFLALGGGWEDAPAD